jgi:hypothetical protein
LWFTNPPVEGGDAKAADGSAVEGGKKIVVFVGLIEVAFFAGVDPAGGAGEIDIKNLYIG